MKVSCVCCTYGRFGFVRRSLACWLNQDYADAELIVFNTAEEPLVLDDALHARGVRLINQSRDTVDGLPYASLGAVRRDALAHAHGDVYVCWDDDDLYLPWHLSQGMAHLERCGRGAWMPAQSYFSNDGGRTYQLARNAFEASVLVRIEHLHRYGFDVGKSGAEHLTWRMTMVAEGELSEHDEVTPFESYAYVWGEPGHKLSGEIDRPDNFDRHRAQSTDFGGGETLRPESQDKLEALYANIYASYPVPALAERLNGYLKTRRVGDHAAMTT
jgi:hypothetical protein